VSGGASFSTASSGATGILVLSVANDTVMAGYAQANRAYLVPLSALLANTQYHVHIDYTDRNSTGVVTSSNADYTFTTGASQG
jgi:hypothetical protein